MDGRGGGQADGWAPAPALFPPVRCSRGGGDGGAHAGPCEVGFPTRAYRLGTPTPTEPPTPTPSPPRFRSLEPGAAGRKAVRFSVETGNSSQPLSSSLYRRLAQSVPRAGAGAPLRSAPGRCPSPAGAPAALRQQLSPPALPPPVHGRQPPALTPGRSRGHRGHPRPLRPGPGRAGPGG